MALFKSPSLTVQSVYGISIIYIFIFSFLVIKSFISSIYLTAAYSIALERIFHTINNTITIM